MFNIDFSGSYSGNGLNGFDCMVRHQEDLDNAINIWQSNGYFDKASLFAIAEDICGNLTKADKRYLSKHCVF